MTSPYEPNQPRAWSEPEPTRAFANDPVYRDLAARDDRYQRYGDYQHYDTASAEEPRPALRGKSEESERTSTPLTEMFRLSSLWVEMVIIAIVGGIVYGMAVWVVDLLAVRASEATTGDYLALADTTMYVVRGVILAAAILAAAGIILGLYRSVNNPDGVFLWGFLVVALWAVIVLLTNPLWQSIPEVGLLLIGAGIIWTVVPTRIAAYRTTAPRLR